MEMTALIRLGLFDWLFIAFVAIVIVVGLIIHYAGNGKARRITRNHIIRNTKDEHMRQILIDEREEERK